MTKTRRLKKTGSPFAWLVLVALWACVSTTWAQQVYWSPASGTLQQGKANRLSLTFEGCSPEDNFEVPQVSGLDLQNIGRGSSMNIINGAISKKIVLQFQASPSTQGRVAIPAFEAQTDQGKIRVPEAVFEITEASIGTSGAKPSDVFFSEIIPLDDKVYAGEVFKIRYVIAINRNYRVNEVSEPQWSPSGLVVGALENPQQQEFNYKGERYIGLVYNVDAMATKPGELQINGVRQTVSLVVGQRPGFIFNDPVIENYNVDSTTPTLTIYPLPAGAPPSFDGAVGSFTLDSKLVPEAVQVGEPVTWTLSLKGTGNWPQNVGLSPRNIPLSFRDLKSNPVKIISEKSPFEGSVSEDIVLIPLKAGNFSMGLFEFSYFDPKTERYETLAIPAKTVSVTPLASAPIVPGSSGQYPAASQGQPLDLDPTGLNLLTKPIDLPAAPLLPGQTGRIPEGEINYQLIGLACASPALLWALLALANALWNDPNKGRRQAYHQLQRIASAQNSGENAEALKSGLTAWRKAVRRFWMIDAEEPSSQQVRLAVSNRSTPENGAVWETLWTGSDRALFSSKTSVESDWFANLREALKRSPKANRSLRAFFTGQAWTVSKK